MSSFVACVLSVPFLARIFCTPSSVKGSEPAGLVAFDLLKSVVGLRQLLECARAYSLCLTIFNSCCNVSPAAPTDFGCLSGAVSSGESSFDEHPFQASRIGRIFFAWVYRYTSSSSVYSNIFSSATR